MNSSTKRVNKKLNLIKILSERKNVTLPDLQKIGGFKDLSSLKQELGELFMVGSFPYTPMDFIEVEYDGNTVSLRMPVDVRNAITLNVQELIELRKIIGEEIEKTSDAHSRRILQKIQTKIKAVIPHTEFKKNSRTIEIVERAVEEGTQLHFQYSGRGGKQEKERTVDPFFVFFNKEFYMAAFCNAENAPRTYRLAGMKDISVSKEKVKSRQKFNREKYISAFNNFIEKAESSSEGAEILFSESIEYNLSQVLDPKILNSKKFFKGKNWVHAKVKIMEENWFKDLIKSFGKEIIVLQPEHIRMTIAEEIENTPLPSLLNALPR
ncbi:MAG: WYL domain-containing protein [Leptospira sp.]|nr:WYL domain-containing protein [Leptospira sp.]